MKNPVQAIPFLRITLAFAAGILIAQKLSVPYYYAAGLAVFLLTALYLFQRNYHYGRELPVGWLITFLFLLFGVFFTIKINQKPDFYTAGKFSAIVLETPEEKDNSFKTILKIRHVYRNDSVIGSHEKILAYFEKTEHVAQLNAGEVILFDGEPRFVKNNGNPYEFDYKSYLARKKIYRLLYLRNDSWKETGQQVNSLPILAEKAREKLLLIYRSQNLGSEETEILSALTLGYKRGLDPETKRVFSAAGAMHVLAVSGLHVGILYAVFILLFGFLRKNRNGRFVFVLGSLFVLWGYAFITGLSPSVMRAATMFSLVCIASNIQRRPNIYNSLSFAAFLLLLINPNNLFEVGFQLSFAAVFGIVFLQPRLAWLWQVKNHFLKFFWSLLTVSIAAQVATFPFTSYYFSQFPSYFWLSNLVVIPAAFLMIGLGIGLLMFSQVPVLSPILAFLTKWVIHIVFLFLKAIENLPASVIEIGIQPVQALLIGGTLISLFVFLSNRHIRALKSTLLLILLALGLTFTNKLVQLSHYEFIAYNNSDNPVLQFIHGQKNYVISEFPLHPDDFIFREISSVKTKKQLNAPVFLNASTSFENEDLFLKNGVILFDGKTFVFELPKLSIPGNIQPDYLLCRNSRYSNSSSNIQPSVTIDLSAYPRELTTSSVFAVANKGAFHETWHSKPIQTNDH